MCEPITATTAGYYALAAAAAGAAVSAYGQYSQAQTAKTVAKNNAAADELAAQAAQAKGEKDAQAAQRQGSQLEGSQRAAYAARGLDLGVGTPADVVDQTDFFTQSDVATARNNGNRDAAAIRTQGRNQALQADAINPGLTLAGSLLSSGGAVASKWYSTSNKGNS